MTEIRDTRKVIRKKDDDVSDTHYAVHSEHHYATLLHTNSGFHRLSVHEEK